jgi:hypothetical protein
MIASDLVGTAAEIVDALRADPVFDEVSELRYAFACQEYSRSSPASSP